MAGMLREDNSFGNVVKATVIAAVHVLILVASTDLGTAFVFFMAYVVVIYVATRKARYPLLGLAGMSAACVVAYFLFSHVRNRVALWQDPIGNWDISSQLALRHVLRRMVRNRPFRGTARHYPGCNERLYFLCDL